MKKKDFENLISGLYDALAYAKSERKAGLRVHTVRVDRNFVAQTRLNAGLSQEDFAKVTGASLGTVRKWETGERSPSGAAQMLVRVLARAPEIVMAEAGLSKTLQRKRRSKAA